ncbi:MAG: DUF123 domain-containing protein [Deltaproteobacteria bacterium]|nr:MAG: DUF123 domain-containing protein [Deltaproteobacteria bacterium]
MKGVYTLILLLRKKKKVYKWSLQPGYYYYTGSALNNLEARVKRHFKKEKRKRWHIDYLTTDDDVELIGAICAGTNVKMECKVNRAISKLGEVIVGFGSSDCKSKCGGHLFRTEELKRSEILMEYRRLGLNPYVISFTAV